MPLGLREVLTDFAWCLSGWSTESWTKGPEPKLTPRWTFQPNVISVSTHINQYHWQYDSCSLSCIHLSLFRNWIRPEVQGNCWNIPSKCIECDGLVMICLQPNTFTSLFHLFVTPSCCSGDLSFLKHTIPWYYSRNSVFLRLSSLCQSFVLRALSKTRLVFI